MVDRVFRKHFWAIRLFAIALASYWAARTVARGIEATVFLGDGAAAAPLRSRRPVPFSPSTAVHRNKNGQVVVDRNIFCSDCAPVEEPQDMPTSNDPVRSSLPLQLVATLMSEDPRWSFAALRDTQERKTGLFGVGSIVPPSASEVVTIEERRVFVRNGGRLEYIDLEGGGAAPPPVASHVAPKLPVGDADTGPLAAAELDKGVRKASETQYEIDRGLVDKVLGDPAFLARSARIVPSVKDGAANGFKIYAIRPGSVYSRVGLSNGDTIHAINGNEISSPDRALEVYTKVRNASHITVSLTRRGQPMTLDYSVR